MDLVKLKRTARDGDAAMPRDVAWEDFLSRGQARAAHTSLLGADPRRLLPGAR
jgi:hypothetical protein